MRTTIRALLAAALLLVALPCIAAGSNALHDQNGFNPRMLDTSVPLAQRLQLFAHVIQLADAGQVPAQALAGTMYWQGKNIAGSPVATNLAQARKLLANAAVHGDVMAMAKMAELELGAGHAQKAMIWAQLYAHYLNPMMHAREQHGRRYAYATSLMERAIAAGGKVDQGVRASVGSMVTRFDKPIRAGILAIKHQHRSGRTHLITRYQGNPTREQTNWNGVADFMVAFKPDGSIAHVWLLGQWPTDKMAAMLRPWLDTAYANKVDASAGMRYLEIPITYNALKGKRLRASHAH